MAKGQVIGADVFGSMVATGAELPKATRVVEPRENLRMIAARAKLTESFDNKTAMVLPLAVEAVKGFVGYLQKVGRSMEPKLTVRSSYDAESGTLTIQAVTARKRAAKKVTE